MYLMSVIPLFFSYDGDSHRLLYQDFSLPMTSNDILIAPTSVIPRDYYRLWRVNADQNYNQIGSTIKMDKNKFQINLDVQHFAPEEIAVKTVDGFVVIEGRHEEKKDEHGYISRFFNRRYMLPDGSNPELVECKLSSDGVLSVIAPKFSPEAQIERAVSITPTGPVRMEAKEPIVPPTPSSTSTTDAEQ